MKKSFRVKKDREFQKVFRKGKSTANRQFVIYKYNKEDQSHFRVGISVSKKLGNAVTRNRLKRRIRHILMELDDQFGARCRFYRYCSSTHRTNVLSRNEKQYDACFKISYNIT